jgi:HK97 family phage major capsid protein
MCRGGAFRFLDGALPAGGRDVTTIEKRQERGRLIAEMRKLMDAATAAARALTPDEWREFDRLDLEQGRLGETIAQEDPQFRGMRTFAGRDGLPALEREMARPLETGLRPIPAGQAAGHHRPGELRLLTPAESLRDHVRGALPDGLRHGDLHLGRLIRGLIIGDLRGCEAEVRAMGTGTLSGGGAMVGEALSARLIDLARARSVCFAAGARAFEMPEATVSFARVAQDPVPEWHGESATITETPVGLERVSLRAKTLAALTRASLELVQDAPNSADVIERSLAASLAVAMDAAFLRGTVGSLSPTGVRDYPGVQTIAAVGALSLDDFADAAGLIAAVNGPGPEALTAVLSPRDAKTIDKLKDGEGAPLIGPPSWQKMGKLTTTSLPSTLGGGTESEAIVGPFGEMVVGVRLDLRVEVSREASDAFSKYQALVRCVWRGDMVLEHEDHFVCLLGITG